MRHAKQGSLPGAASVTRPALEQHAFGQVQPSSHRMGLQDGSVPAMQQGSRPQHASLPPPQHAHRQAPLRISPGAQNLRLPDMQQSRTLQHPPPLASRDRPQQVSMPEIPPPPLWPAQQWISRTPTSAQSQSQPYMAISNIEAGPPPPLPPSRPPSFPSCTPCSPHRAQA